jgi:hypothetical protein
MEIKKVKVFLIYAGTGCTCCNNENHYRGAYRTKEEAESRLKEFQEMPLLASQFARKGCYSIEEREGEMLPDKRIILESDVIDGFYDETGDDYIGDL